MHRVFHNRTQTGFTHRFTKTPLFMHFSTARYTICFLLGWMLLSWTVGCQDCSAGISAASGCVEVIYGTWPSCLWISLHAIHAVFVTCHVFYHKRCLSETLVEQSATCWHAEEEGIGCSSCQEATELDPQVVRRNYNVMCTWSPEITCLHYLCASRKQCNICLAVETAADSLWCQQKLEHVTAHISLESVY